MAALPFTPVVMVGRDKMRNRSPPGPAFRRVRKQGSQSTFGVPCRVAFKAASPPVHKLVPHKIARLNNPAVCNPRSKPPCPPRRQRPSCNDTLGHPPLLKEQAPLSYPSLMNSWRISPPGQEERGRMMQQHLLKYLDNKKVQPELLLKKKLMVKYLRKTLEWDLAVCSRNSTPLQSHCGSCGSPQRTRMGRKRLRQSLSA